MSGGIIVRVLHSGASLCAGWDYDKSVPSMLDGTPGPLLTYLKRIPKNPEKKKEIVEKK